MGQDTVSRVHAVSAFLVPRHCQLSRSFYIASWYNYVALHIASFTRPVRPGIESSIQKAVHGTEATPTN